jgi:hypothetical protein
MTEISIVLPVSQMIHLVKVFACESILSGAPAQTMLEQLDSSGPLSEETCQNTCEPKLERSRSPVQKLCQYYYCCEQRLATNILLRFCEESGNFA